MHNMEWSRTTSSPLAVYVATLLRWSGCFSMPLNCFEGQFWVSWQCELNTILKFERPSHRKNCVPRMVAIEGSTKPSRFDFGVRQLRIDVCGFGAILCTGIKLNVLLFNRLRMSELAQHLRIYQRRMERERERSRMHFSNQSLRRGAEHYDQIPNGIHPGWRWPGHGRIRYVGGIYLDHCHCHHQADRSIDWDRLHRHQDCPDALTSVP